MELTILLLLAPFALLLVLLVPGWLAFGPDSALLSTYDNTPLSGDAKFRYIPFILIGALTTFFTMLIGVRYGLEDIIFWMYKFMQWMSIYLVLYCIGIRVFLSLRKRQVSLTLFAFSALILLGLTKSNTVWVTNLVPIVFAWCVLIALRNVSLAKFTVLIALIMAIDVILVLVTGHIVEMSNNRVISQQGMVIVEAYSAGSLIAKSGLGMGDIALPGLLFMIAYRQGRELKTCWLWLAAFVGYLIGLGAAITFTFLVYSTQPATIYVVPGSLLGYWLAARAKGFSLKQLRET